MRVAALYDIHGNLPALEAVLADVAREGVDAIVIGGDIAAGPPQPREVIELHVAKDDVGKVIGRQGRIARALRTVVRASAARCSGRTLLEIVE